MGQSVTCMRALHSEPMFINCQQPLDTDIITNLSQNCVPAARQEKTLNYFRGKPEPSRKLNNQNKVQSNQVHKHVGMSGRMIPLSRNLTSFLTYLLDNCQFIQSVNNKDQQFL